MNPNCLVIGVVGGMGPRAGIALYNSILNNTPAYSDQEHLSVILMSYSNMLPDRTRYLEGKEFVNPAIAIAGIIAKLEQAGAVVIGIPCNTSHCPEIYNRVLIELDKRRSGIRMVNMPDETCKCIMDIGPHIKRVAVMSTNGTHKTGLYYDLLRKYGFEVIVPDEIMQQTIHDMIYNKDYGIKAVSNPISGEVNAGMQNVLSYFKARSAQAIIIGCTELSLIVREGIVNGMQIIDSTESLARALVREATNGVGASKRLQGSN